MMVVMMVMMTMRIALLLMVLVVMLLVVCVTYTGATNATSTTKQVCWENVIVSSEHHRIVTVVVGHLVGVTWWCHWIPHG